VRIFLFETRFLRYVMLRITPVGMTERSLAFFGEESVCFLEPRLIVLPAGIWYAASIMTR